MLHDKYDTEVEHAVGLLPYDSRDNDESGAGMFWDLAGQIVNDLQYYKPQERQEILYNVLHKVRESTTLELLNYAKTLPNYSYEELEAIRDFIDLVREREQLEL